jgi:hypothetical protein
MSEKVRYLHRKSTRGEAEDREEEVAVLGGR